ncbi:MAG: enoyl-CoA hydratase-related protein [Clostridia bacterium]|nr:enoyl-CoA hydratase-related protein [Clostridia bacterium]
MAYVRYETEGPVGLLTLDRPEALNALSSAVLDALRETLDRIDLKHIRALVVTGAGEKAFAAGADVAEMETLSKEAAFAFGKKGNDLFLAIERFPIPVIAAVNGYALGGGCELAMCCDIRLCSENAVFGQPEVTLGITPGFGGTQRLARIVGAGRARELIFSARSVKAEEALRIGLVNAVYPLAELLPEAMKLAGRIARNAPIAVRAAKRALNEGVALPMDEAAAVEETYFSSCFLSEDQREGMRAFLEKRRPPEFQNK